MDNADLAMAFEEQARSVAMTKRAPIGPPPKGECYFCEEPLPSPERWCAGGECRDLWLATTKKDKR